VVNQPSAAHPRNPPPPDGFNRGEYRDLVEEERTVTTEVFEEHGVRFEYPSEWAVEVTDEGDVTTVDVQDPGGVAFLLVRIDESCPDPTEVAELALEAMREDYPELDAVPIVETLDGHLATGYDVEFFSLDIANAACIRCFHTPRRTVLVFGQWSDLGEQNLPDLVAGMLRSLEETDD
jgi:hypothetical protein